MYRIAIVLEPMVHQWLTVRALRHKPRGGAVFAFRGCKGDRLKLLYRDGQGFCLYYTVLQRGRFPWPNTAAAAACLTSAQLVEHNVGPEQKSSA